MRVRNWSLAFATVVISALCAIAQSPETLQPSYSLVTGLPFVPLTQAASQPAGKLDLRLPLKDKSVRFAVIGDSGTGDRDQYEVAREMEAYWEVMKFDFVIMLGDNVYGSHTPKDFARKFEEPYKRLL